MLGSVRDRGGKSAEPMLLNELEVDSQLDALKVCLAYKLECLVANRWAIVQDGWGGTGWTIWLYMSYHHMCDLQNIRIISSKDRPGVRGQQGPRAMLTHWVMCISLMNNMDATWMQHGCDSKATSARSTQHWQHRLTTKLHIGSDATCGDDARNLRTTVVEWVDTLYGPSVPQLRLGSKDKRSLNNNSTSWVPVNIIIIGMMQSEWISLLLANVTNLNFYSVWAKIQDGDPDFTVTAGFWPVCMHAVQTCDPEACRKVYFCQHY